MLSKPYKILLYAIRLVLIVLALVVVGFLIQKDLVMSGRLEVEADFKKLGPYISVLKPQDRVQGPIIDEQGNYWQKIIFEPVYFDVRVPRHFKQAYITLTYENLDQKQLSLGVLVDRPNWLFDLKPVITDDTSQMGQTKQITLIFEDFSQADVTNGQVRFILSLPQIESGDQGILLDNIKIMFIREPMTYADLFNKIKERLL